MEEVSRPSSPSSGRGPHRAVVEPHPQRGRTGLRPGQHRARAGSSTAAASPTCVNDPHPGARRAARRGGAGRRRGVGRHPRHRPCGAAPPAAVPAAAMLGSERPSSLVDSAPLGDLVEHLGRRGVLALTCQPPTSRSSRDNVTMTTGWLARPSWNGRVAARPHPRACQRAGLVALSVGSVQATLALYPDDEAAATGLAGVLDESFGDRDVRTAGVADRGRAGRVQDCDDGRLPHGRARLRRRGGTPARRRTRVGTSSWA